MTTCKICGSALGKELLVHFKPDRFETHVGISSDGYVRKWLACEGCGSATNIHTPENVEKLKEIASNYYEIDFANSHISEKYKKIMNLPDEASDNADRVFRMQKLFSRLGHFENQTSRVLDIGAGTGVFLSKFLQKEAKTDRKWTALAVEPDPNAVAHLRQLKLFDVDANIYDDKYEGGNFDLITLNKVVEHLDDPNALVKSAGRGLNAENGILYVEVPDVLTIGRRADTDNIVGALHNYLYSTMGLDITFKQAGLETLEVFRMVEPSGKLSVAGFAVCPEFIDRWSKKF